MKKIRVTEKTIEQNMIFANLRSCLGVWDGELQASGCPDGKLDFGPKIDELKLRPKTSSI